jgi:hypothetical protein
MIAHLHKTAFSLLRGCSATLSLPDDFLRHNKPSPSTAPLSVVACSWILDERAQRLRLSCSASSMRMSDPFPFPSTPSSQFPENEPVYGWVASGFSQASFPSQGPFVATSNQAEASNTSTIVPSLNSKVAIPRSVSSTAVPTRGRVSRACENCREQKVKCSGHRPSCQRCQESGIQCSYGDRKREKLARCEA